MVQIDIKHYPTLGSTNEEAKRLLSLNAAEGTIIWADQQTAGRGRQGRPWISIPGGLYCSIIVRPRCSLYQAGQLSFMTAVAVGKTFETFVRDPTVIAYKWPNDVLLDGKKVSGILLETESTGKDSLEGVVVGVGINVIQELSTGVNLQSFCRCSLSVAGVLNVLLECFFKLYTQWQQEGFLAIRAQWLERIFGLNSTITVRLPKQTFQGTFLGLNEEGALILRRDQGEDLLITSAEVFF
jgi:BirA family biotin operon repressor/biotin-[acetyl-CoA-carboxylase] ligase